MGVVGVVDGCMCAGQRFSNRRRHQSSVQPFFFFTTLGEITVLIA